MKTSSPAFESLHSLPNKELRLVVKIDFPTPVYFTSHSDISIPGATVFASSLFRTSSTSAKLNPDEARTEIGTISFEIIDKAGAITQHFRNELNNDNGLKGQFVELYSGYAGLPFEDFRLEQTQIIDKSLTHDGGTYRVQCRDIQREMRKDIFDLAKTRLSATVEKGANSISVYDTNGFEANPHGASYGDQPGQSLIYFKIKYKNGFEICSATGKTANTFTGVTRGLFGTSDIKHEVPQDSNPDNGPEVIEFVYLELPAPKLAYALLTGKLIGEANTIPSGWNLGIPESFVDIDDFTGIGTDLYDPTDDSKGFICRFEAIEKTDGKRFIETQVCFPTMFFTVKANGKIGLRRMNGVLSNADYIDTLDASNITKASDLEQDFTRVHSVIDVHWSWYEFQGRKPQFYRRNTVIDPQSLVRHNKGKTDKPLTIQLKGLHNSRHTYTTLKNLFNALRDRYAGPPLEMTVDLLPSKNGLEIADLVRVKLDHLRDLSGDDTLDRTFEIQQVTIDQLSGKITAKLFGSSEAAGPISDGASYVLPDGWYSSEGTNASSVLTIDGAGSLTADGTLTGNASSRTIYFYLGDLTIPSGRVLSITENVELRVLGHLQVDGAIQASSNSVSAAYLGTTQGGTGQYDTIQYQSYVNPAWQGKVETGKHAVCPPLDIENNAGVLVGLPQDMRGSGGGNGGAEVNSAGEIVAIGGTGGKGGGSLAVISRGMAMGASGSIVTDGADGGLASGGFAGDGGGGAPGCFVFLQDGSQGTTPFLQGKVSASFGSNPGDRPGKGNIQLGAAATRIIFIPQSREPYPDYVIDENILNNAQRIYRQPAAPSNPNVNDLWYDTSSQNHPYVWDGSAWVDAQDGELFDAAASAQATADAANQAAAAAQVDADAANLDISRMSSDGYLTPVEKKRLIREVEDILDEEADIVAKADIYGITAEKNNYQQDIVDLNNYLATLDSPVLWNNLSGSTLIPDWSWFKSYFALVYATRQKLLNKIAEEAGKVADWGGVTGDNRPADNAGTTLTLLTHSAVTAKGNTVKRTTGSGWGAKFHSKNAAIGSAQLTATVPSTNKTMMIGLSANPQLSGNYADIDYAMYIRSDGKLSVYESGSAKTFGDPVYAAGDTVSIVYDGVTVKYYHNQTLVYTTTTPPPAGTAFFVEGDLNSSLSELTDIYFSPAISNTAEWGSVTGSGRPADNATVGADWGINLGQRPLNLTQLGGNESLLNDDLVLNTDGTLYDAGAAVNRGVVTIGGLGYNGDLNATYGATAAQARQLGRATTVFMETFDTPESLQDWSSSTNATWLDMTTTSVFKRGGGYIRVGDNAGNDMLWAWSNQRIPYDPDLLYKITAYAYKDAGTGTAYFGVTGFAWDQTTFVNVSGSNFSSSQHYVAASGVNIPSTLTKYVGYFSGHAASGNAGVHPNPEDPATLHNEVRFFSPMFLVNYSGQPGQTFIDAIIVEAFDKTTMRNVHSTIINPAQLADGLAIDQGDGNYRRAPFGLGQGTVRDGDSITFATPFSTPPRINFRGGVTYSSTLTGKHALVAKAINLSNSGFDASIRVKELAGSVTPHTDSAGAANVDGLDFVKHKSQSAQAYDDTYTFQIDVQVVNTFDSESGTYIPGSIKVGYYTNDGTGWVKRDEKTFQGNTGSSKTYTNDTHSIVIDGLSNHAGYEFAVDVVQVLSGSGSILAFDNVKYSTATAPSDETGTPTGAEDAFWETLAGQ